MASSSAYLMALHGMGYQFRYNELTDRVEVNGTPISDVISAEIRTKMRDAGHKSMTSVEDAYTAHAWQQCYNPVRDYLTGLVWDGQPYIAKIGDYITDEHAIFAQFLRRWMIGAVAKVFRPARNFMLVLDGPQEIGKSYFARWLCPNILDDYFIEGGINPDDKDTWIRLSSKWIWELSELGATTRRADREALKDFISRQEVVIRRPYGRHDIVKPALSSLIGTINEEGPGFLNDPTGSSRFGVVTVTGIDYAYTTELDIDQLWAEAMVAYQDGESWLLTAAERATRNAINEEYEVDTPLEALLRKHYNIDPAGTSWISGIDIIQELEFYGLKDNQRASLMELARVMKRAGIERRRVSRVWSYRGVTKR
jgi:putative DNA primase/helicase